MLFARVRFLGPFNGVDMVIRWLNCSGPASKTPRSEGYTHISAIQDPQQVRPVQGCIGRGAGRSHERVDLRVARANSAELRILDRNHTVDHVRADGLSLHAFGLLTL